MASNIPLPPDANEAVAKACGFTPNEGIEALHPEIFWNEWNDGHSPFYPATDPAAAVKAWEVYVDCCLGVLKVHKGRWRSEIIGLDQTFDGGFCYVICAAILEAEKVRTK